MSEIKPDHVIVRRCEISRRLVAAIWFFSFIILQSQFIVKDAHAATKFVIYETPKSIPDINFKNEQGATKKLSNYKGKYILLNIWATWCKPCREEMPTLDNLKKQLGSKRFDVLALSLDRAGPKVVQKFYNEIGIKNLEIIVDEKTKAMRSLRVLGLPTTLLVGPNGQEIGRLIGPAEWDSKEMIRFLQKQIQVEQ